MKIVHLVSACTAALMLLAGTSAFAVLKIVEEAFESSTAEVRIPAAAGESLAMRHCPDCEPVTLTITPETRFYVDEQQVTQADFRRAANRGTFGMTVHYDPETLAVTRVVMDVS
jgi:hypothetical protein